MIHKTPVVLSPRKNMKLFLSVLTMLTMQTQMSSATIVTVRHKERVMPDEYIVKMSDDCDLRKFIASQTFVDRVGGRTHLADKVMRMYNRTKFGNLFIAKLNGDQVNALNTAKQVEIITPNQKFRAYRTVKQENAVWNLARLSHTSWSQQIHNYTYAYDSSAGEGSTVYILDTGCTEHEDFENRAIQGPSFVYNESTDGDGHGTHCAGIIGGKRYGVAKRCKMVCVKVLDNKGDGSFGNILNAMNWVAEQPVPKNHKKIINMSFGGDYNPFFNMCIDKAVIDHNIYVVTAAGNDLSDACWESPSSAASAITVGASNEEDHMSFYSNYGPCVDIIAPGDQIETTSNESPTSVTTVSGTSYAAPQVAGLIAYLIGLEELKTTGECFKRLQQLALKSVLRGVPQNTVNLLAHNVLARVKRRKSRIRIC